MFANYLKVFLHNLYRQKVITAINIVGLAIGFACVFLISLYVRYEVTFDQMHPDFDRTYLVPVLHEETGNTGDLNYSWFVPFVLENIPEIEVASRVMPISLPLAGNGKVFEEKGIRVVDPAIFGLFAFEWISGDPQHALNEPFNIVITESIAKRYFGNEDPMGKLLLLNTHLDVTVTGVVNDLNPHSHFNGEIFTPVSTVTKAYGAQQFENGQTNFRSYIKLRENVDVEGSKDSIRALIAEHARTRSPTLNSAIDFVRLDDVHLSPQVDNLDSFTRKKSNNLLVLSTIAVCILLVACVNYVNLATAQAFKRIKEVGMRKTVGAGRQQLLGQFLVESVLMSWIAAIFALALIEGVLPFFSNFLGISDIFDLTPKWLAIGCLLLGCTGVGVIAGLYPGLFVSSYHPGKTLKQGFGGLGIIVRNSLVVFQFSVAIALIVAVTTVYAQLQFSRQFDSGFNKDQVLTFRGSGSTNLVFYWENLKNSLLQSPNIEKAALANRLPGEEFGLQTWFVRHRESDQMIETHLMPVGYDFIEAFEIELLAGRTFDSMRGNDLLPGPQQEKRDGAFILNKSAIAQLDWGAEEAIGKSIELGSEGEFTGYIVGVVADTYYESTFGAKQPMVYFLGANFLPYFHGVVKISGRDIQGTFDHIQKSWNAVIPEHPLSIKFFDQEFDKIYQRNQRQGQLISSFAVVAIVIACFGLFGLARFNVERRTKEIGIRKVHGSSVWQVVVLLSSDFSKLVLLANVIAWPVAYFAMNRWLENFAYRIDLTPVIFIGSGLIALCIAWVTVGGTAAKAASQKPVLALRYE